LKDYGDKIPEAEKTAIEAAITKLKEAHKAEDMDRLSAFWSLRGVSLFVA
jgi:molecular chaperone DnaK